MDEYVVDYVGMGLRIRAARKQKRMTQQKFADLIGVSTSYVGHIEKGIKRCSLETLASICKVTGVDANELIFGAMAMTSSDHQKIILDYLNSQIRLFTKK